MICRKCGNELEEGEKFCGKCGTKQVLESANYYAVNEVEKKKKRKKAKFSLLEVINRDDLDETTNKVAYIAKCWALKVWNRGQNFGILAFIIYLVYGFILQSNTDYYDKTQYWLIYFVYGIIAMLIIIAVFNTTAFVIRMGAEAIQLLNDIKEKKGSE